MFYRLSICFLYLFQSTLGRSVPLPVDVCLPLPCPFPDCEERGLGPVIQTTYINDDGVECPGCPTCGPICPQVKCAPRICRWGQELTENYYTHNGQQCKGCPVCKPKKSCNRICPRCKPAPFYVQKYDRFGCPLCPPCDGTAVQCPIPKCPLPVCSYDQELVDNYFDYNGIRCRGCSVCKPKNKCDFACPACAPPPGYVDTYDKNGCRRCNPCGVGVEV